MLNKKECRKFAAPVLNLDPDNGLLYASRVDYIVCTDIQAIDGQDVLILHFVPRSQATKGDYRPVWTMFQGPEDYITLERGDDGKTKWRTAAFEKLGNDYRFSASCAFYTAADERRVSSYFKSKYTGFTPLISAQDAILAERFKEKKRRKEQAILARMEGLPALPGGLESWARREVLPAYFVYSHARKGIAKGTCSCCGEESELSGVKYKGKAICPHCSRDMTMTPRGMVKHIHDKDTGVVVQRAGTGLIVRILKIHAEYQGEAPAISIDENVRQFVGVGPDGGAKCERYYLSHGGELTDWKEGTRPVFYNQATYESATYGYLYCGNLPGELEGTPWQYCPIVPFYRYDKEPMEVYPFLAAHVKHPRYEHLVKVGFYDLVCQLVYHYHNYYPAPELDEGQNRTHRILGVGAEDVGFLRELKVEPEALQLFQAYYRARMKDRQRLLLWQMDRKIKKDLLPALAHTTAHKLMRYIDGQYAALKGRKAEYGGLRYESVKAVVGEYMDYLDMCQRQNYDLKNSFVLYPKDLQKSHDRVAQRIKIKADMKMREDFQAAYRRIMGQLDFERDGMKIVYPASLDDIVAEGQALHHCVGSYVDKVAARKTMILFLRKSEDVEKPYYTVEVKNREVMQVRGAGNQEPTPAVEKFMAAWERKVLHGRDLEMEAAA